MAYVDNKPSTIWSTKLTANDSTAKESIGAVRELADGRKFKYVKMTGGALAAAQLAIPATTVDIDDLTSANGVGPDGATTTIITYSAGTWTPDAYIGWYFKTDTSMTGSEEAIKIVGNSATTLTLEKQITTALAAGGTDDGEILAPTGVVKISAVDSQSQAVAGVGIGTLTQNYYGWIQTWGYGNVLATSGLTEGQTTMPGGATSTGQAADGGTSVDEVVLGTTIAAGDANEAQLVDLRIS